MARKYSQQPAGISVKPAIQNLGGRTTHKIVHGEGAEVPFGTEVDGTLGQPARVKNRHFAPSQVSNKNIHLKP